MNDDIKDIIYRALRITNFKVMYAGDLSKFMDELNNELEIKIKQYEEE
jgi:hypothetical protein